MGHNHNYNSSKKIHAQNYSYEESPNLSSSTLILKVEGGCMWWKYYVLMYENGK
jgi:hypothetical protein